VQYTENTVLYLAQLYIDHTKLRTYNAESGAKSYDSENAWSFINNSMLSATNYREQKHFLAVFRGHIVEQVSLLKCYLIYKLTINLSTLYIVHSEKFMPCTEDEVPCRFKTMDLFFSIIKTAKWVKRDGFWSNIKLCTYI